MSRLEELMKELCPDGVEYKTIGEIAIDIFRGSGITRDQITEEGTPCVRYGEIYTTYGVWFEKCVSHTNAEKINNAKYFEHGDILFAITGESIEDIAKSCAYLGQEKCLAGGDIVVLKHKENPKFLAYALTTLNARIQKSKGKVKSKVVHSSVPAIKEIKIPVPPLEIQNEIVRILDNFIEHTEELNTKLEMERAARKKQYQYYSQLLLNGFQKESQMVPLSSLGKWQSGKTPSMQEQRFWQDGTIPWISSKDMKFPVLTDTEDHITEVALTEASMNLLPEGSVAIVTRSGILKHTFPVAYVPFRTTINQDIKALSVAEGISAEYVAFVLQAYGEDIRLKTKKQGGTVDSLDFQKILNYQIPLPEYEVQLRIVNVLDNFESICNDLNIRLPAEIEARKKQYEYYRDQILTFNEYGGRFIDHIVEMK